MADGNSDEGLKAVSALKGLATLNLNQTKVTDAVLKCLDELPRLTSLNLSNTQVSDAGMKVIAGLSGLEHLYLGRAKITDVGLKIRGLKSLASLEIYDMPITDAGLHEFAT